MSLKNKKILIVIGGGISAYKALDLIRLLKKNNVNVKTILTKSGKEFVTPLSITSLSKNKVYTDLFSVENESEMDHISLSRWSDLILVAPASSNFLTKISNGFSDDLASTVIKASDKKVFLCPAMNVRMWEHASNKQSISTLKSYGYRILGPEIGEMACGEFGEGKMLEVDEIINQLELYFKQISKNKKLKAIVTAGPTQELIDPVRFITNRSSGKQGYEIANSLVENGFDTTIGENGVKLSGGEKQRLSIARAFLKDSKIILLDEATSSLDSETEEKIQKAIDKLTSNKTTVVIAHRLSTILNSDRIYVLDKGSVVAEGKHDQLLNSSDIYKNFYNKQIKNN